MFSNRVRVEVVTEDHHKYYEHVQLPRPVAMLHNAGDVAWQFLIHHYRPQVLSLFLPILQSLLQSDGPVCGHSLAGEDSMMKQVAKEEMYCVSERKLKWHHRVRRSAGVFPSMWSCDACGSIRERSTPS